ncbi:MAG TPA: endonuclease/exonuclease/phosphatase family protein [Bryobacteraceae bacterium]|jgi:endonuclease/exonuclease/phosphatase family metal-dependent hydrolase
MQVDDPPQEQLYAAVASEILPRLEALARCRSTADLELHPEYRAIAPLIADSLAMPHIADFRRREAPSRPHYRVLAWNIERGTQLAAQLEAFRSHPYLKTCDVLLLTEADAGMARSGNRMVAEVLARELGMAQIFGPCYIALGKGSGVERHAEGDNRFGLHGNALLSRYPIRDARLIPLDNGVDKMAHREKRLGRQVAVAATIDFPNLSLRAVSVHLDAQSTQRHRRDQMRAILDSVPFDLPVILGGDWNTSTYDSSRARRAIVGFALRVLMGVDHVIRNHYLYPQRLFERGLFRLLVERGFEYERSNRLGEHTICYDVCDPRATGNLREWVPEWCFAFIRWALRNHGGRCPMKLDWFATRELRVENPVVIHELREGRAEPMSDHDAIGVDIVV